MEIELPFPDKKLSPNARIHWAVRSKAVKKHREWAHATTFHQMVTNKLKRSPFLGRIKVYASFIPPGNYGYDKDGLASRLKAYQDGIADALGVDDKLFDPQPIEILEPSKDSRVIIRLEDSK